MIRVLLEEVGPGPDVFRLVVELPAVPRQGESITIPALGETADKDGQAGYAVFYPDGYKSWCPKAEFERTARPVSGNEATLISGIA